MKKNRWVFALIVLLISSLACNALTRSAKPTATTEPATESGGEVEATQAPGEENTAEAMPTTAETSPTTAATSGFDTDFPLPPNVSDFTNMGEGGINFQTKMSLKDAIAFYRDAFTKAGYKERQVNTAISDTTFSMVFDGHSSGKAIVIQGVDMMNGAININIRLEDI